MTLTNGKIGSISDLVDIPTRQQEGDEAMKQKWYEERAQEIIRQEDMVSLTEALTVQDAACAALARKALMAREPLATEAIDWLDSITRPATVQPEDETTLPALGIDIKDYNRSNGHVEFRQEELEIREAQLLAAMRDLKTVLDRESSTTARHYDQLDALESERDALKAERDAERSSKDTAYSERDRLVCALSKLFPSWLERHPDLDTAWEDDWRWIVFVSFPTGQASWHIHDSEVSWFYHLERRDGNSWDGHSTAEKYARIERFKLIGELDAVVGQETPQEIWNRAFAWVDRHGWMSELDEYPPYTPPLKAGQ